MRQIDLYRAAWAISLALPFWFFAYCVQRVRGRTRRMVLVAGDLTTLLAGGNVARALLRVEEVGGSLDRGAQALLGQMLQEPSNGAAKVVRIADACVAFPRARALLLASVGLIPVGLSLGQLGRRYDSGVEHDMLDIGAIYMVAYSSFIALAIFGVVACVSYIALPIYLDRCKGRVIRSLGEVQRAAEKCPPARGNDTEPRARGAELS